MQERHGNRKKYFTEQSVTIKKYVFPMLDSVDKITHETSVLEIGCGEGGNLLEFVEFGCKRVVGIDMAANKIENGKEYFKDVPNSENLELICSDIFDIENLGQFDIILTRDVLEHIHGQEKFMEFVKKFLKPGGKFFLGFPPWQNPFGGHQQLCKSKVLSKLPYYHILPKFMYGPILKLFKETPEKIEALMEIKDTRISIERFERILKKSNYKKDQRIFYFINPNYEVKFGLKPRVIWPVFSWIPYFRNYLITTNYYIVSLKNNN